MRTLGDIDDKRTDRRVYAEVDRTFSFGAVVPTENPDGVKERFKIMNPNKISATVMFSVVQRGDNGGGKKGGGSTEKAIFTVHPSTVDLPPHEHRYVTVYFRPEQMRMYTASFSAEVENGADESTRRLVFDIGGQGTLPCLTVEKPLDVASSGALLMSFGKLQIGKSRSAPIVIRNDGIVPCSVHFDMPVHDAFSFPARNTSITLAPRASETMNVSFCPSDPDTEKYTCCLLMSVLHNRFDRTTVELVGEGYVQDVTFEDLPSGLEDELVFGEQDLTDESYGRTVTFSLCNHVDSSQRFEFGEHRDFNFAPRVGHIMPHSSKRIAATFCSSEGKVAYDKEGVMLQVSRITLEDGVGEGWDDGATVVTFDEDTKESIMSTVPEPAHKVESTRSLGLGCTARADSASFEVSCDRSINFRDTLMYQSRAHKFTLTNTSTTTLEFVWGMENTAPPLPAGKGLLEIPNPFAVEPSEGIIPPGSSSTIDIRFSPLEVDDFYYVATASILHLPPDVDPLVLQLRGRSHRPVCHFELPHSDYLTRRPLDMPGPDGEVKPLESSTRVIEMNSLGTHVKNTCRFTVINPMNVGYDFVWKPLGDGNPLFRCATSKGLMLPGRRYEMVFEYTPGDPNENDESFWEFGIPQRGVTALFLVVGHVLEPHVTLDTAHINFRHHLVGSRGTEIVHLLNSEHIPFSYCFNRGSLGGTGVMSVDPMMGVVPPNGRVPISVTFSPTEEKQFNFNLVCDVQRKPSRLSLNVKGEGYAVHEQLLLESVTGGDGDHVDDVIELASGSLNFVDFGRIYVNAKASKHVVLTNTGKHNYDFVWGGALTHPTLKLSPCNGTVRKGERVACVLEFNPVRPVSLAGAHLSCTVAGSRTYALCVSGTGDEALVEFGFQAYDFGACFVARPGDGSESQSETVSLRISNNEMDADITIDCPFEKTHHLNVEFEATVLRPHSAIDVPITFSPGSIAAYHDVVQFEVNGLYRVNIEFRGEGVHLNVGLADPKQSLVKFGSLSVGQSVARSVRLVNRSKRAATVEFEQMSDPLVGAGRLEHRCISYYPTRAVTLQPRESTHVELRFSPMSRIASFSEELRMRVNGGAARRLLTIQGACLGVEVTMETDCLPFGAVCEGSSVTRKLQLENSGDLVTIFKWDAILFAPNFSISPTEGVLAPHSQIMFDVTFHPTSVSDDIRNDLPRCFIEGAEALPLALTGSCTPMGVEETVEFSSRVRESVSKSVSLKNPAIKEWVLHPSFSHEYWSGAETIVVPAGGTTNYDIQYFPLTMTRGGDGDTTSDDVHKGSVFFALPDGSAVAYSLVGRADPPVAEVAPTDLLLVTSAKKALVVPLPVRNWLKGVQRFVVAIDSPDGSPSTFLRGPRTHAVPPLGERNYKMTFFAYTEGVTNARITFTNEVTGEYLFYELKLTATEAGVMDTLTLNCPVRQSVKQMITLENPLRAGGGSITFPTDWWECDDPNVRVTQVGDMADQAEGTFEVEFRPLVVCEEGKPARLKLFIDQLGTYTYDMTLKSKDAATDRSLHFKTALGSTETKVFRFESYVRGGSVEYKCKVDQPLFFDVPSSIKVDAAPDWGGVDASVEVAFEPEALGEVRDMITLSNNKGGVYKCMLYGVCVPPVPQGPIDIASGSSASVRFKNVFNKDHKFRMSVDNPCFSVDKAEQAVGAKKEISIGIKFAGDGSDTKSVTGKLLVNCPEITGMPPWVFYLHGLAKSGGGGGGGGKKK